MEDNKPIVKWRTVSIFVSSTFVDMDVERDYLKRIIEPKLNEYFAEDRVAVRFVDLRMGIKTNNINDIGERETIVLKVCIDEINRSRPFFMALLGDRYGWIPPADRYESFLNRIENFENKQNADGKSVTEIEIMLGALSKNNFKNSIFYFRNPSSYNGMTETEAADYRDSYSVTMTAEQKENAVDKLNKLKETIKAESVKNNAAESVKNYSLKWDKGSFTNLTHWGDSVEKDLIRLIKNDIEKNEGTNNKDWYYYETISLESFIHKHNLNFVGRGELLEKAEKAALSGKKGFMFYFGSSGTGKSAFMCKLYTNLLKTVPTDTFVLFHSVQASPLSKSSVKMLQRWSKQVAGMLNVGYDEIMNENKYRKAIKTKQSFERTVADQFCSLLDSATEKGMKAVILIDGFDNFDITENNDLTFLHNYRTLATCAPANQITLFPESLGKIHEYIPPLSKEDALLISSTLYPDVRHILVEKQNKDRFAYQSLLWLRMSVDMISALDIDDFRKIRGRQEDDGEKRIEKYTLELAQSLPPAPEDLFLELMAKAETNFGQELVQRSFVYIALTRKGLRERDLSVLLGSQWDELKFASLRRWFRNYLIESDDEKFWYFNSDIIISSIIKNVPDIKSCHCNIAQLLLSLSPDDTLRIYETMYHLYQGDMRAETVEYYAEVTDVELNESTRFIINLLIEDGQKINWFISLVEEYKNFMFIFNMDTGLSILKRYGLSDICYKFNIVALKNLNLILEQKNNKDIYEIKTAVVNMYMECGNRCMTINQNDTAKYYLNEGKKRCLKLIEEYPGYEGVYINVALIYYLLGNLYGSTSADISLKTYKEGISLVENQKSILIKNNLGVLYSSAGFALTNLGKYHEALQYYEKAKTIYLEIYSDGQTACDVIASTYYNFDNQDNLGMTYYKIGNCYFNLGEYSKAQDAYEESLKLTKEIYKLESDIYEENYIKTLFALCQCCVKARSDKADRYLLDMKKYYLIQNQIHPDSDKIQLNIALIYGLWGEFYDYDNGDLNSALDYYTRYRLRIFKLLSKSPDDENYLYHYALSSFRAALCFYKLNNLDKAFDSVSESIKVLNKLGESFEFAESVYMLYNTLRQSDLKEESEYVFDLFEKEEYNILVSHTLYKDNLTEDERFYTALSLLRIGIEGKAFDMFASIVQNSGDGNIIFASTVNMLVCLLCSGKIAEYLFHYENVDDKSDSDVEEVHESYKNWLSRHDKKATPSAFLRKPLGYLP